MGSELTGSGRGRGLAGCSTACRAWPGTPRTVTELPGGLTNHNYKVTTPDGAFVARLCPAAATCWRSTATTSTATRWPPPRPASARR